MKTRLPKDPATNKPEPLLSFKRGALVHFAVSQYEAYMTTQLAGNETRFLPFNRGIYACQERQDWYRDFARKSIDRGRLR